MSSSSADSWSLVEDGLGTTIEESDDAEQQHAATGHQRSIENIIFKNDDESAKNAADAKIIVDQQLDATMAIAANSNVIALPLDLSTALLPQHLLLVRTPASSSLVTPSGAILSPKQSAEALANNGNNIASAPESPTLLSPPPRSPPIESTFTFLKDPKLRISFSSSYESKTEEEAEEDEGSDALVEHEDQNVRELNGQEQMEKNANVDRKEEEDDDDDGRSAVEVITDGNEEFDEEECLTDELETADDQQQQQCENVNLEKNHDEGKQNEGNEEKSEMAKEVDGTDNVMKETHGDFVANQQTALQSESQTLTTKAAAMMIIQMDEVLCVNNDDDVDQPESNAAVECENTTNTAEVDNPPPSVPVPTLTEQLPTSIFDVLETNKRHSSPTVTSSTGAAASTTTDGTGDWTELCNSWTAMCSSSSSSLETDDISKLIAIPVCNDAAENVSEGNGKNMLNEKDPVLLVARRMDELSEQTAFSPWQRFLQDRMFGTLTKNLDHGMVDRIINVLIVAMFLTSLSSMTILHILEYSWMGSNGGGGGGPGFSSSISQPNHQHYRHHRGMANAKHSLLLLPRYHKRLLRAQEVTARGRLQENQQQQQMMAHFRADSQALADQWNIELRQCQDELFEARHAYESKAKLLHYVRFKEMEQEAIVDELKRELEQAKLELERIAASQQKKQANLLPSIPSTSDISSTAILGDVRKHAHSKLRYKRVQERRVATAAMAQKKKTKETTQMIRRHEPKEEQMVPIPQIYPPPPPVLLTPDPRFLRTQLIAPPAALTSYLTAPPVVRHNKQPPEERQIVLDDDDGRQTYSEGYYSDDDEEKEDGKKPQENYANSKETDCPANIQIDEQEEMSEETTTEATEGFFGGKFLSNWRKYNEILQNLSTHSGRTQMLQTVRNVMVARLNRTIEKTTTALSAATKLMIAENFGKNLFKSTLKEWMARGQGETRWSALMDTLSGGGNNVPRFEPMKLCRGFLGTIEEAAERLKQEWNKNEDEEWEAIDADKVVEGRQEQREESAQQNQEDDVCQVTEKPIPPRELRNGTEQQQQSDKKTEIEWHLQRATIRAQLRRRRHHQQVDNEQTDGNNGNSNTEQAANIQFAHWLFVRAALRKRQRELQNGTGNDNWLFARQKMRAQLRAAHTQSDWLFVRQRLREKARQRETEAHQQQAEDDGDDDAEWFFTRQKLRQKFRRSWKSLKKQTKSTAKKAKEELEKLRAWWNERYSTTGDDTYSD